MIRAAHTLPDPTELEVSVFGPGVGESAVIHVGGGRWVIVDSCRDSRSGVVSSLAYLRSLDLEPAHCVDWVVATHGHDDHVAGFAETVIACANADVVFPDAACEEEFLAVAEIDQDLEFYSTRWQVYGEFDAALREMEGPARRAHLHFAGEGKHLPLGVAPGAPLELEFLAPSSYATLRSRKTFGRLLKLAVSGEGNKRLSCRDPNTFSLALMVRCLGKSVLLGGDVKNGSTAWGWRRVVMFLNQQSPANVFKVAHHGDPKAHDNTLWSQFLTQDCVCIVAPYRPSGRPKPSDIALMKTTHSDIYTTATASAIAPSKTVTDVKAKVRFLSNVGEAGGVVGQVRLRQASGAAPVVQTIGVARRL